MKISNMSDKEKMNFAIKAAKCESKNELFDLLEEVDLVENGRFPPVLP